MLNLIQRHRTAVHFVMADRDDILLPVLSLTNASIELAGRLGRNLAAGKNIKYQGCMQLIPATPPELVKDGWRINLSPLRKIGPPAKSRGTSSGTPPERLPAISWQISE
jgi:hypothetical protein